MKNLFLVFITFTLVISCSSDDEENCSIPQNVSFSIADENYAIFSFTTEKKWPITLIEFGEPGFELGVNAIGISQYIPLHIGLGDYRKHVLYDLEPNKDYEAYIKQQCEGLSTSEYYGPISFTTLVLGEGCTQPDFLVALEKTSNTILIDWEGYNKEDWLVEIKPLDDEFYNTHYVSEKPFLIEDLTPETEYYISVKTNYCEGYFETSSPSNVITVVTNE